MDLTKINKSTFENTPFIKRVEKPWGYELLLSPDNFPYATKIVHIFAGKRTSLHVHDKKRETDVLIAGKCNLILDNKQGELVETAMEVKKGYSAQIGQRHRLHAITDCDVFESATPEIGTTYRLEDDFQRGKETEEERKASRKKVETK